MSASYRLFGAETSAFSTKLRSFMRYKGLEHEWVARTQETEEALQEASRFTTLPVLVTASGFAVHDTTPTMEALEADSPEPQATPEDKVCAFLSVVLEDYADIWLSKAVMQYRWGRKKDRKAAAARAIDEYFVSQAPDNRKELEEQSIERMESSFAKMGLENDVGAAVEKSFKRFVKLLNAHLEKHLYIFGGRPSFADFGIAAQIGQLLKDPTSATIIEKDGQFIKAWVDMMDNPKPGGPFEAFDALEETLKPLFKKEIAVTFLPWGAANLEASLAREEEVVVLAGRDELKHAPLKSAARSFKDTRRKFSAQDDESDLIAFLDAVGATQYLRRPERVRAEGEDGDGDDGNRRRGRRGRRRGGRNRRNDRQDAQSGDNGAETVSDAQGSDDGQASSDADTENA